MNYQSEITPPPHDREVLVLLNLIVLTLDPNLTQKALRSRLRPFWKITPYGVEGRRSVDSAIYRAVKSGFIKTERDFSSLIRLTHDGLNYIQQNPRIAGMMVSPSLCGAYERWILTLRRAA